MPITTKLIPPALVACTLALAACGGSGSTTTAGVKGAQATKSGNASVLVGAGSTLVAPLLSQWQGDYAKAHKVTVTYGAIGSGGGIAQISGNTVDFGASDAPLTVDEKKGCQGCVMLPWALAATTVSYNLPGVKQQLKLSGPVIAGMFLGTVKTWNDPAIRKLNPGVTLPGTAVHPVFRSDASGDTFAFTDYLSHVSPAFRSKVGTSTQVSWPTGSGAKGNSGVAASVTQTPGAVAYVAIGQATGSNLTYALVQNKAGQFPAPNPQTIAAAGATARFRPDNSVSIVDPPASARNAYTISTFTYAIVHRSSPKLAALKQFFTYSVTTGQKAATKFSFAPLPAGVVAKDKQIVSGL